MVRDWRSKTGKVSMAPSSHAAWMVTWEPVAMEPAGSIGLPSVAAKLSPTSAGLWFGWYAACHARASASEASGRSQVTRSSPIARAPPAVTVTGWK